MTAASALRVERIGHAVLYLGDCRELMPTLRAVRAIVSDPPYGIAHAHSGGGRRGAYAGLSPRRNLKPIVGDDAAFDPSHLFGRDVPIILFGADHYVCALPAGGMFHVWDKHCGRGGRDSFSDCELFWTNWTRKRECYRYLWKGLCTDGPNVPRQHPTQKPVPLMRFCIELLPRGEGAICDPYMGSGSTGVAAAALGLPFVGIEIDEEHFAAACARIADATRQPPLFGGAS